jgi:methyl-accepting chemotaxis protein
MQWTLGVILLVVIAVMTVIWLGLQHLLLKPLHSVMGHIRAIADGDLTQPISAEGRNEMSQLAGGLHEMQSSLVKTVSAVRNSSDSIYTGASEISTGNNDLFPHRTTGLVTRRDRRQYGAVDRNGETEHR